MQQEVIRLYDEYSMFEEQMMQNFSEFGVDAFDRLVWGGTLPKEESYIRYELGKHAFFQRGFTPDVYTHPGVLLLRSLEEKSSDQESKRE